MKNYLVKLSTLHFDSRKGDDMGASYVFRPCKTSNLLWTDLA